VEPERRKQLLLVGLVAVLVVVASLVYRGQTATSGAPPQSSNRTGAARAPSAQAPAGTPDVNLEALDVERSKPASSERNLFRFRPKPPPPPPAPVAVAPAPVVPSGPPPPPPPPAIPYKFIGLVEVPGQSKRIAVLSDGRNVPLHGREGDIIEGRYRIIRIGAESIEMEYVDGRGRQTIRLSGS
jgi:hypothetical protein